MTRPQARVYVERTPAGNIIISSHKTDEPPNVRNTITLTVSQTRELIALLENATAASSMRNRRRTMAHDELGQMDEIFVIVRSTGEYSDRTDTPILWAKTENEAKQLIELADIQRQSGAERPPCRWETSYSWQDEHGNELEYGNPDLKYRPRKNLDKINHQNEIWESEFYAACRALGHVDPEGCWPDNLYEYHKVIRARNVLENKP